MRKSARIASMLLCAALAGAMTSCAGINDKPRARLGALPFPGPLSLYVSSQVSELGPHCYAPAAPLVSGDGARGIVYTCRAGFLDLAHVRESVDWTWWLHLQAGTLLRDGGGSFRFENDETEFELVVRLSPELDALPRAEQAAVREEAAIRLGQRAAYIVQTWHEIETWYGLRTVFFVPEDRSTFTWDDTTSHAVGIWIGAAVISSADGDYDRTAAAAIRSELEGLGAVPRPWVDKAVRRVCGRWWTGPEPLRRDLDTGLSTGVKEPWVVPALECCTGVEPMQLEVPSLRNVRGHDLTRMYAIRLTPARPMATKLYKGRAVPTSIDAEQEVPALIEQLRAELKAKYGSEVDRP